MAILWRDPIRTLPNGRVLRLVRPRQTRVVRVSVDGIIVAVLAAFGALSLVVVVMWILLRLIFG